MPRFLSLAINVDLGPRLAGDLRGPILETFGGVGLFAQSQVPPIGGRLQRHCKVVVGIGDTGRSAMIAQGIEGIRLEPSGVAKLKRDTPICRQRSKEGLKTLGVFFAFGGS